MQNVLLVLRAPPEAGGCVGPKRPGEAIDSKSQPKSNMTSLNKSESLPLAQPFASCSPPALPSFGTLHPWFMHDPEALDPSWGVVPWGGGGGRDKMDRGWGLIKADSCLHANCPCWIQWGWPGSGLTSIALHGFLFFFFTHNKLNVSSPCDVFAVDANPIKELATFNGDRGEYNQLHVQIPTNPLSVSNQLVSATNKIRTKESRILLWSAGWRIE